jgi:hypothetical protein
VRDGGADRTGFCFSLALFLGVFWWRTTWVRYSNTHIVKAYHGHGAEKSVAFLAQVIFWLAYRTLLAC